MKLNPYIIFSGNAKEVIAFYADALQATITVMSTYGESPEKCDDDWKDKIIHGRLEFDGNLLMISDGFKGYDAPTPSNIQLSIEVESVEKLNTVFEKLSAGGKIKMPLQDTFWGARFGMLEDKFGVQWMLNHELKK
jgi:PhnB protein